MKSLDLVMGFVILGSCCCFVVDCQSVEMQQDGKRSDCVVENEGAWLEFAIVFEIYLEICSELCLQKGSLRETSTQEKQI